MMQLGKLLGQGILAGDGIVTGFDRATQWSAADVWCLAFGYGLQLFFDFAGYSHIAIGAAKALGITVPENFGRPFASTNPAVFWTRWHMSLSFWIRDYIFFPVATLRRETWWRYLALAFSMIVFGLWHKATLLFLIWGGYHGVLLVSHRLLQQLERRFNWQPPKIWTPLSWLATATLISLGWIFFRANSLTQAGQLLAAVASPVSYASHYLSSSLYLLIGVLAAGYAVVLLISDALDRLTVPSDASRSGMMALIARSRWFWLPAV
jgi:alginate O-acetyltransferase complex protein AlgI